MRRWLLALVPALGCPLILLAAAGMGNAQEQASELLSGTIDLDREAPGEAPGIVTYETWFREGTQVAFDHELHVAMEMGCTPCHHLEGCEDCHRQESRDQLVSSAKVAMHTACFECHTQSPGGGDCEICHQAAPGAAGAEGAGGAGEGAPGATRKPQPGVTAAPKLGPAVQESLMQGVLAVEAEDRVSARPSQEEVAGLEAPDDHVFVTDYEGTTLVAFSHAAHAGGYGLDCATCHHLERCRACHAIRSRAVAVSSTEEALHASCIGCHSELSGPTDCAACHRKPTR